jgi:hypothetical protein
MADEMRKPDDHAGPTGVNPEALRQGYEPDTLNVGAVLSVPAAVVVAMSLSIVVVLTILSYTLRPTKPEDAVHPLAVKSGNAPMNERLARISPGSTVSQPRLEGLKRIDNGEQPPYLRSFPAAKEGNSQMYYPEHLRPENVPALKSYAWVDKGKDIASIPIAQAMAAALEGKIYKTRANPVDPNALTSRLPKASNSGRGGAAPAAAHDHEGEKK